MSVLAPQGQAGEEEARRFRTLYQLLAALSQASELEDVYRAALASLLQATTADRAAILLFEEDGVIRFQASHGLSPEYQTAVTGHCPWEQGARDAKPVLIPDVAQDNSLKDRRDALEREGISALAFLPLALDQGVFGKFMLYWAEPHPSDPKELEIAQAIAAHVALAAQRKRAELAGARSEKRFQAILDNTANVIFIKDLSGRYILVNRHFEDIFRIKRADIIGRTSLDIFPAEVAERFHRNDEVVLSAGKPMIFEEVVPQADGEHVYLSMKFPLEEPPGKITGLCGIATDITERKQLALATQHLAAIVESSADAIIGKDLEGTITSWNTGAELLFGYAASEVVGKPVGILAPPDHADEMPRILSKVRAGDRVEHFETVRRKKNGEIIDVSLTVSPIRDGSGQIVGASKISRDITLQKRAERERAILLEREQEARTTAELLNRVAPRMAAQLDLEKLVQEVTDIATTLVGAEFGSFFHNVVNEKGESYMLYTISGVAREAFSKFPMPRNTEVFAPTFAGTGIVRSDDITKDPRYGKMSPHHGMPKGHLPVRSYLAAPVVSRSGEVLGGLFFGHSTPGKFTENHEAILNGVAAQAAIAMDNARLFEQAQWSHAELKRSNEELRRANRDLEIFAHSASHDLQEPLRTIAISAELIEQGTGQKLQGDEGMFLANIRTSASRMNALVEDLQAYARATKYEEGMAPGVETAQVLADVLESLQALIQETGAVVTAGDLPAVAIHENRLAQLFQNLIGNAIKYRKHQEVPRVHVSGVEQEGWCVFSVADNGIGIEREFSEQIFGLFKRLHGRDEYPGSGIGLAICQRIVERYGGRIWLEQSEPGRGSTFCFSVPSRT